MAMSNREHRVDGRDIIENPCTELPELKVIGKTEIQKALPSLDIEHDPNCCNIYLGYKGSKQMQCQGKAYSLAGGEFFITPKGVDHSTGPMPISKCAHYWLRIHLGLDRAFLGDPQLESLRHSYLSSPVLHGKYNEQMLSIMRCIFDISNAQPNASQALELRLQLSLFLLKLIEITPEQNASEKGDIEHIKQHLELHIGEDLSVKDMANIMGCSTTTLTNLFLKSEGQSPADYFNRLKMERAKQLLLSSQDSVLSISQQLGYANPRYFSTVFKRYFIEPPGKFRQQKA